MGASLDLLSAACFGGFLLAALAVRILQGRPRWRRRALNVLLLYVLAASLGAGLTQHEAWPFSRWSLAATPGVTAVTTVRLLGVDAGGREHPIDARAWEPLALDELLPWVQTRFPRLDAVARDRVGGFLLDRAERARLRARAGSLGGRLRLLSAPRFLLHPRVWRTAGSVPAQPFVRLRIYQESWDLETRARDESAVRRVLLYEFPRP